MAASAAALVQGPKDMPSRFHVIVAEPFDHYKAAGARAVLSAGGYDRIASKKSRLIELQAEETEDGRLVADGKAIATASARELFEGDGNLKSNWKELFEKAPAFVPVDGQADGQALTRTRPAGAARTRA